MSVELKSCPFCGGEVERENPMPGYVSGHGFYCDKCGAHFQLGSNDDEAAKAWNTREERTCHMLKVNLYDDEGIEGIECDECGWTEAYYWDAPLPSRCKGCDAKVLD